MTDTKPALSFGCIPIAALDIVWKDVADLLAPAVETAGGKFTVSDVLSDLECGNLLLWLVVDGTVPIAAITTRIIVYPRRRAMAMDWIGGGRMREWLPIAIPTLERFARDNACEHLEGYGRKAWGRWLERYRWKPDYIAYRMELSDHG